MRLRGVVLALGAGLAAFLTVGAAATAVALQWIEYSLLVGVPVGLVVGVTAVAVVVVGLRGEASVRQRRAGVTVAAFGTTFLLVLFGSVGAFSVSNSRALVFATATGLLTGVGVFALDYTGTAVIAG